MSNKKSDAKKKTTTTSAKKTRPKTVKKVTVEKTKTEPVKKAATQTKSTKKKESFITKYGTLLVVGALLVVFGIILVATNDNNKNSASAKSPFISMSVDEWQESVKKDKVLVTTLAQTTCSWCNQFKPVAQEVASENNIKIVWIDVDTLSSEEEYNKLTGTFEQLKSFGTPYTIITKSGKVIGEISGYVEKAELLNTLKKHGAIK